MPLDGRTDLYAAGVVLCEMLTGRTPFSAGSLTELRNAHLLTPPPPLSRLNPDVVIPPGLEALVLRALEKNPNDRFPSAQLFYEALSEQFQSSSFSVWGLLAGGAEQQALGALTAPVRLFRRGEPLALMPYVFVR